MIFIKKFFHYLLAFLIPVAIFLFAMYLMDLYPFGDTSIRVIDAISQYPAFFEGLKDGDLFTFKIGMGTNFYTIWTTYLASPLSLLYFFFENYQFDLFFVILVLLKIGLIGLNMNILLNYKKERNKYSLIFSTIYALSGFVSLYYFNYQFLDALYMLPLIMIGIEKLVNDNKNLMYFITLTLMIIFHYYTAYMICIFSVIYFFFLLVNSELEKKDKRKRIIKFFVTSLFCGLCSSFITIPSIYGLLQGRSSYVDGVNFLGFNKDSLSFFYNFTAGSLLPTNLGNKITPSFITLFVFLLMIFAFFDKNSSKKYKKSLFIIIVIYILSLSLNFMYYGWHFFKEPQGLPGRFIFVFNCFFVLISYKTFLNVNKINLKNKKWILFLILAFLILISFNFRFMIENKSIENIESSYWILIIFNLFILLWYIFFYANKKLFIVTVFLIFLEILINVIMSFNVIYSYNGKHLNSTFVEKTFQINEIVNNIYTSDKSFYRIEINRELNGGLFYNFNGINYYSSLYNKNYVNFFENYNLFSSYVLLYNNNTFMNSLIAAKYVIIEEKDQFKIFKNNIINSLGFMVYENEFKDQKNNIIENFNDFTNSKYPLKFNTISPKITLKNIIHKNNQYSIIDESKDGKIILNYYVEKDCYINEDFDLYNTYINLENGYEIFAGNIIDLYLNDEEIYHLSNLSSGDNLKIIVNVPKELSNIIISYDKIDTIDKNNYDLLINDLNRNIITNIEFNYSGFTGELQVNDEKKLLLITVPYDEGIKIYANGKEQIYTKVLDGIIGLNLEPKDYIIEFKYSVKGLKLGIIISSISLFIFIFSKVLEKIIIYRYNNDNKEEIYK